MNNEVPSYFLGGMLGGAMSQLFNRGVVPNIKQAAQQVAQQPQQAQPMQCADGSAPRPGGINQVQSPNPAEEPDAPPQSAEEAAIVDQTAEQIKDDIATGSMGGGFQKVFQNILGTAGMGTAARPNFGPPTVFLPGSNRGGGFFGGGNTNPMDPLMRIRSQSSPVFGGMGMGSAARSGGGFFGRGGLSNLLGIGPRTTSRMAPRILGRGLGGLFGRMF